MIKRYYKELFKIIKKPEMEILPGHLAFSLVISMAPILTLLVLVGSFFSISVDSIINLMTKTFPKDVTNLLIPFIEGSGFDINVGVYLTVGFLIASNGLYSIILTSNALYKNQSSKPSTTLKRRIKAIFLTLMLLCLFVFVVFVLAFGNYLVKLISGLFLDPHAIETIYKIFVFMKWPIGFFAVFFTVNVIYAFAPDVAIASKYTRRGAIFTTCVWMIVTAIYSYYVSHIARYDILYGSLSSIMIMMIWIYMLSYVFVFGIALNASSYKVGINDINKEAKKENNNNDILS